MKRSESIAKLAIALAKFNGEVSSIEKDAKNPFFKSDYVTLDKLILSTRELLHKNGLSVLQFPLTEENKIGVQTLLLHESGAFIESEILYMAPAKANDPQQAGSLITYLRRYSYQAILNLNTGNDDDGNLATHGVKTPQGKTSQDNSQKLTEAMLRRLYAIGAKAKYSKEKLDALIFAKYKCKAENLTKDQYDYVCGSLEKAEVK